jgi:hypothetical protein
MKTFITILLTLSIWYSLGIASFIFWETRKHNILYRTIPLMMGVGLLGPLAFPIGFMIRGEDLFDNDTIFIPKS